MRWISVEEKLPPYQRMVLLYARSNYNTANGITWGWYDVGSNCFMHRISTGVVKVDNQFKNNGESAVTHWTKIDPPHVKVDND